MNFRRRHQPEEPEINLIPFIDVLLVILIFLMLTTTYSKLTELKINLPTANAEASKPRPKEMVVLVTADGRYLVNQHMLEGRSVEVLAAGLANASAGSKDTVVIVTADASATHQSVINVMDAARRVGLTQLTFATQGQTESGAGAAQP
ncbi:MAG: biopolymer transporter ExbD [Aquabacterium sp.]